MSGHYAMNVASYLGSTTRKVLLAAYHLRTFKSAFARLSPDAFGEVGPEDPFVPLDANADGCVLQLFGALDAFSCAAAWHFALGNDRERDGYSFGRLVASPPPPVATVVTKLAQSAKYQELRKQRHRAGHRGMGSQKRSFGRHKGFRLETIDGTDAEEILDRLFTWGQGAVRLLQGLACLQEWPGSAPHRTYLLTRWGAPLRV